jgi:hypothetical protein
VLHAEPSTFTQSPAAEHTLSAPHAEPQQIPPTQVRPAPHLPAAHEAPLPGSGAQVEPLHTYPAAQSSLLVQLVLQLVVPHA